MLITSTFSSCSSTKPYYHTGVNPTKILEISQGQLKYFGDNYVTSKGIYLAIEGLASIKADPSKIRKTENGFEIKQLQYENNSIDDINWIAKQADKMGEKDKIITYDKIEELMKKLM